MKDDSGNVGLYMELLKQRTAADQTTTCRQMAEYASERGAPITPKAVSSWAHKRAEDGVLIKSIYYCELAKRPVAHYKLVANRGDMISKIPWSITDSNRAACVLGSVHRRDFA